MRVAVVGAGLAGLSCACVLERHGIKPQIFEKKDSVGERLIDVSCTLALFDRFQGSPLDFLQEEYGIPVTPLASLQKIRMFAPGKEMSAEGELGYVYQRGRNSNSLENQIRKLVNTPVLTNCEFQLKDTESDFDYVVMATGEESAAKKLGVWKQCFSSFVRAAVVLGDFTPGTVDMWLNTRYCKNGFAYLLPQNEKLGMLVLVVNNVSANEFEFYWREFLLTEKPSYTIIETRDSSYNTGVVRPARIGNVFLAGNSGGFVDDLLGFGMMSAIESGCMAAWSIVHNLDYNLLTKPIYQHVRRLHEFRKAMNSLDNHGLDKLVSFMDTTEIKQLIYNNKHAKAAQGTFAVRMFNALKGVRS
jgi:digeranylgeranylglycerophospholipid reductase